MGKQSKKDKEIDAAIAKHNNARKRADSDKQACYSGKMEPPDRVVVDPKFPRYVVSVRMPKFGWTHVGAFYSAQDAEECMSMWHHRHGGLYDITVVYADDAVAQCWSSFNQIDGSYNYNRK